MHWILQHRGSYHPSTIDREQELPLNSEEIILFDEMWEQTKNICDAQINMYGAYCEGLKIKPIPRDENGDELSVSVASDSSEVRSEHEGLMEVEAPENFQSGIDSGKEEKSPEPISQIQPPPNFEQQENFPVFDPSTHVNHNEPSYDEILKIEQQQEESEIENEIEIQIEIEKTIEKEKKEKEEKRKRAKQCKNYARGLFDPLDKKDDNDDSDKEKKKKSRVYYPHSGPM